MKYIELLTALLALGDKLPAVFAEVQKIVAAVQAIVALVRPSDDGTLQLWDVTPEEAELELQVAAAMVPEGSHALFDGTLLRRLFSFARDNPELMAVLIKLLSGK